MQAWVVVGWKPAVSMQGSSQLTHMDMLRLCKRHHLQPLLAPLLPPMGSSQQQQTQAQGQSRARAMPPWYGYLTKCICVYMQCVETYNVIWLCASFVALGCSAKVRKRLRCACHVTALFHHTPVLRRGPPYSALTLNSFRKIDAVVFLHDQTCVVLPCQFADKLHNNACLCPLLLHSVQSPAMCKHSTLCDSCHVLPSYHVPNNALCLEQSVFRGLTAYFRKLHAQVTLLIWRAKRQCRLYRRSCGLAAAPECLQPACSNSQ